MVLNLAQPKDAHINQRLQTEKIIRKALAGHRDKIRWC